MPIGGGEHMAAPAVAIMARRRKIIRQFAENGALTPETAKTPEEVGSFKGLGRMYASLQRQGILKACGDGRYYVVAEAADTTSREIRSRAMIFGGVMIALTIAFLNATATIPLWASIAGVAIALILIAAGAGLMRSTIGPSDHE